MKRQSQILVYVQDYELNSYLEAKVQIRHSQTKEWQIQVPYDKRTTATQIDAGQLNAIGMCMDNDGDGVTEFSQWYGYGRLDVNAAIVAALA